APAERARPRPARHPHPTGRRCEPRDVRPHAAGAARHGRLAARHVGRAQRGPGGAAGLRRAVPARPRAVPAARRAAAHRPDRPHARAAAGRRRHRCHAGRGGPLMRTLAVVGTAGGVGTTTVAALAFAGLRHHPHGAPMLYARPSAHLIDRVGDDQVPALNGELAVWDAGVHTPESAAALLEAGGCVLAVAAPATPLGVADAAGMLIPISEPGEEALAGARVAATPLGVADAARMLITISELGEGALAGVAVVLSQVGGRGRAATPHAVPSPLLVRMPYDRALARPGPLPPATALARRTQAAAHAW